MRYTIESRFQGAFLGAAVGDMLGTFITGRSWDQLRLGLNWWDSDIDGRPIRPSPMEGELDQLSPGWGSQAVGGCKSLIARGRVEENSEGNEATAIALPIALFFHEDAAKLRRSLNQLAASSKETRDGILAMGYCLLQIAQEKLDPGSIIPQIITYIQSDGDRASELGQVQTLLETGASLETACSLLSNNISLALYCFLSTPEDFRLSVMRALRIARVQPQLVAALTGAMSGTYNSLAGIPVSWRIAMTRPKTAEKFLNPCWGVTSGAEIVQLATNLFAAWSGVYWPTDPMFSEQFAQSPSGNAVAAPRVMPTLGLGPDK